MVACPCCDMNVIVPAVLRPPRVAARQERMFRSNRRYLHAIDTEGFPFGLAFYDNGDLYAVEREHVSVYSILD